MLAFTQHAHMLLAARAMPFWAGLLSERCAGGRPLTPERSPIPLDCAAALLDLAGDCITPLLPTAAALRATHAAHAPDRLQPIMHADLLPVPRLGAVAWVAWVARHGLARHSAMGDRFVWNQWGMLRAGRVGD